MSVRQARYGWVTMPQGWSGGWRCVWMAAGVLCVTAGGTIVMQLLRALSWGCLHLVSTSNTFSLSLWNNCCAFSSPPPLTFPTLFSLHSITASLFLPLLCSLHFPSPPSLPPFLPPRCYCLWWGPLWCREGANSSDRCAVCGIGVNITGVSQQRCQRGRMRPF